jgi:hypothetical protein
MFGGERNLMAITRRHTYNFKGYIHPFRNVARIPLLEKIHKKGVCRY